MIEICVDYLQYEIFNTFDVLVVSGITFFLGAFSEWYGNRRNKSSQQSLESGGNNG